MTNAPLNVPQNPDSDPPEVPPTPEEELTASLTETFMRSDHIADFIGEVGGDFEFVAEISDLRRTLWGSFAEDFVKNHVLEANIDDVKQLLEQVQTVDLEPSPRLISMSYGDGMMPHNVARIVRGDERVGSDEDAFELFNAYMSHVGALSLESPIDQDLPATHKAFILHAFSRFEKLPAPLSTMGSDTGNTTPEGSAFRLLILNMAHHSQSELPSDSRVSQTEYYNRATAFLQKFAGRSMIMAAAVNNAYHQSADTPTAKTIRADDDINQRFTPLFCITKAYPDTRLQVAMRNLNGPDRYNTDFGRIYAEDLGYEDLYGSGSARQFLDSPYAATIGSGIESIAIDMEGRALTREIRRLEDQYQLRDIVGQEKRLTKQIRFFEKCSRIDETSAMPADEVASLQEEHQTLTKVLRANKKGKYDPNPDRAPQIQSDEEDSYIDTYNQLLKVEIKLAGLTAARDRRESKGRLFKIFSTPISIGTEGEIKRLEEQRARMKEQIQTQYDHKEIARDKVDRQRALVEARLEEINHTELFHTTEPDVIAFGTWTKNVGYEEYFDTAQEYDSKVEDLKRRKNALRSNVPPSVMSWLEVYSDRLSEIETLYGSS